MIIRQHQSAFDLATQISGDVRAVLDFCLENELSITDTIQPGTQSREYETIYQNDVVVNFFAAKEKLLATAEVRANEEPLGIGTMIIETNFDVS